MNPPYHGAAPEQRCWNEDEYRRFLQVAVEHRARPAVWSVALTGMRRGEVLGLRWSDIDLDLDASTLSIRQSVNCTGYQAHTTATKTTTKTAPRGEPSISTESTVTVLREWQQSQRAELGKATPDATVFTRCDGQPVHPHALSQTFELRPRALKLGSRLRYGDGVALRSGRRQVVRGVS